MMKAMLVFAVALLVLVAARAEDSDSENTLDLSRFRLVSPRLLRRGVGVSSFLRSFIRLDKCPVYSGETGCWRGPSF